MMSVAAASGRPSRSMTKYFGEGGLLHLGPEDERRTGDADEAHVGGDGDAGPEVNLKQRLAEPCGLRAIKPCHGWSEILTYGLRIRLTGRNVATGTSK